MKRKPKDKTAAQRQRRARARGMHVSVTLTRPEAIEILRRLRASSDHYTLREILEEALVMMAQQLAKEIAQYRLDHPEPN